MKMRLAITAMAALTTALSGCSILGNGAPIAPGPAGSFAVGWLYSTLFARNAVMEIDVFQSRVSKDPIIVPNGPRALAMDPRGDARYLYVVCELANAVAVVDRRNRQVNRTISVGTRPYDIALTADGRRAFVTNRDSDSVTVIELQSQTVTQTIPLSIQSNQPGAQPGTQPTALRPQGIAVSEDGLRVYVACAGGQVVQLSASSTNGQYSATRNILLSGSVAPLNIAVAPSQGGAGTDQVFVTDPDANRLFFFDTSRQNQTAEQRDITGAPWDLAVGRDPANPTKADRLFVTAKNGNALYPLTLPDLSTATPGGQGVSVEGKEPTAVSVSPDGSQVFVSVSGTPAIAVFQRVRGDLARPEIFNMQQLDSNFIAPTGDIALGPPITGLFVR